VKNTTFIKKAALTTIVWWGSIAPVWAAGGREDNSDLFVWIFLVFCALIVVAQLVPALMVLLGFTKGIKKEAPQEAVKEAVNTLPAQKHSDA
jgi:hypothetical protein